MQPEAQTTTRGSLEIAIVIKGALEVFCLYIYLYSNNSAQESIYTVVIGLCFFYQVGIYITFVSTNIIYLFQFTANYSAFGNYSLKSTPAAFYQLDMNKVPLDLFFVIGAI